MKLTPWLALLLPLLAASCADTAHQPGATKLTVSFPDWQKYTDIKDYFTPTDSGEQGILDELHRALDSDAGHLVPDGDHLTLTFSDIDLAGDFEPGRGPNSEDIRIVKDLYPPRFAFTWSLTDATGRVLKSGQENLTDLNFMQRLTVDTTDRLHYDKAVLNDWMERKMRGI